jgi:hypothetical protein
LRGNLDQVQPGFFGQAERLLQGDDAQVAARVRDQTNLARADFLVDAVI